MAKKPEWEKRRDAVQRAAAIKEALVLAAVVAIERLWSACDKPGGGFLPGERKAIADASYSLRSIKGGWARERRR